MPIRLLPMRAASSSRRRRADVARAPLRSLRRPPARNCRWIKPAKGLGKRSASAGRHGHKDLEQQKLPDRMARARRQHKLQAGERACGAGRARHTVGVVRGVELSCRTTWTPLKRGAPTRWLVHGLHLDLTQSRPPDGHPKRSAKAFENHSLGSMARLRAHSSIWIHGRRA